MFNLAYGDWNRYFKPDFIAKTVQTYDVLKHEVHFFVRTLFGILKWLFGIAKMQRNKLTISVLFAVFGVFFGVSEILFGIAERNRLIIWFTGDCALILRKFIRSCAKTIRNSKIRVQNPEKFVRNSEKFVRNFQNRCSKIPKIVWNFRKLLEIAKNLSEVA